MELVLEPDFGSTLGIPLDAGEFEELGRRADKIGVELTTLVRMWIVEQLHRDAS